MVLFGVWVSILNIQFLSMSNILNCQPTMSLSWSQVVITAGLTNKLLSFKAITFEVFLFIPFTFIHLILINLFIPLSHFILFIQSISLICSSHFILIIPYQIYIDEPYNVWLFTLGHITELVRSHYWWGNLWTTGICIYISFSPKTGECSRSWNCFVQSSPNNKWYQDWKIHLMAEFCVSSVV